MRPCSLIKRGGCFANSFIGCPVKVYIAGFNARLSARFFAASIIALCAVCTPSNVPRAIAVFMRCPP